MIYHKFEELIKSGIKDVTDKGSFVEGAETIPDGMITIHSANDDKFDYKIQVNDQPYYQYHKNNGITKLGFLSGNETKWVTRPTEGALDLSHRMNQAYINKLFPETYIVAGQQFMPFKPNLR